MTSFTRQDPDWSAMIAPKPIVIAAKASSASLAGLSNALGGGPLEAAAEEFPWQDAGPLGQDDW